MARMLIDLQQGTIEIDGDDKFVERVYADLKETLLHKLSVTRAGNTALEGPDEADAIEDTKKRRKKSRTSGPSCASRIEALKADDYFAQLRAAKEIGAKLREKGTAYEAKRVAAALLNMTSSGRLRRIQEEGIWKYQNP